MKNFASGMLYRVALVRTDVSEKRISSIISVKRISELGTTLGVSQQTIGPRVSVHVRSQNP
jgi:hypothetical protein